MLILTRRIGESLKIGSDVTVGDSLSARLIAQYWLWRRVNDN